MENISFKNTWYQSDWEEGYEKGTAWKNEDGSWTIYDGKQNYMGKVKPDGGIVYNGSTSDYKKSFLVSAREALGL